MVHALMGISDHCRGVDVCVRVCRGGKVVAVR